MNDGAEFDLLQQRFERLLSLIETLVPDGLRLELLLVQCDITDEQVRELFRLLEATNIAAKSGEAVSAATFENTVGDIVGDGNAFGSPHALADLIVRALKSNGRFKYATEALSASHWLG